MQYRLADLIWENKLTDWQFSLSIAFAKLANVSLCSKANPVRSVTIEYFDLFNAICHKEFTNISLTRIFHCQIIIHYIP